MYARVKFELGSSLTGIGAVGPKSLSGVILSKVVKFR